MRTSTLQDSVNELMMLHAMGRFTDMEQRARAFLKSFAGAPILVLNTIGARTGQPRTATLGYFPESNDAWIIVGSAGGAVA